MFSWLIGFSRLCCSISYIFVNISVLFLIRFFGFIQLRYGFHPYVCKTCFVVKHVMWSFLENGAHWKRCVCCCCWVEVLYRSVRPYWSLMVKSSLSLLVFFLIVPDIIESRDILVKVIKRTQINGIKRRFLKLGIVLWFCISLRRGRKIHSHQRNPRRP